MALNARHTLWIALRFGVLATASAAVVLCGRLWNSYWAIICLVLFYVALAALGVFAHLGLFAQWCVIALFGIAAVWLLRRTAAPFRWLTRAQVEHAMERAAGIAHRPLAVLRDSAHVPDAQSLWDEHRRQAAGARARVALARWEADVSARDPFDLRHVAGMFFAFALIIGAQHAPARIAAAFAPGLPALPAAAAPAVDIWIAPPAYTQTAPVYLARAQNAQVKLSARPQVPSGSTLKIRISGRRLPPVIRLGGARLAVTRLDGSNYSAETTLTQDAALSLRQGLRQLGSWNIGIIADQAPKLSLLDTGKSGNGLLKITWQTGDDYGLTQLRATITAPAEHADLLDGQDTTSIDLPTPPRPEAGKALDGVFSESIDLSRHLLAGTPVTLVLSAQDDAGHVTRTPAATVTLPERRFTSTAAQRIVAERKRLFWFGKRWPTRDFTTPVLLDVVNDPRLYRGDHTVFLALLSAIKRLAYDARTEAVTSVRDLLWDIALRVEDGGVSEAARDLQQAMADFTAALNDPGATQQQLQELLDKVQQQMQNYMQALAGEMQQRQQQPGQAQLPPDIADKVMKKIDLAAVLQQLRDMTDGDKRQQMRQMMDMLREAMQNMDVGAMARMQQQQQQAMQALQDLADVVRAQQELIEQTAQSGGDTTPQEWQDMAGAQNDINKKLNAAMGKLGPLAGGMQKDLAAAASLMGQSGDRLGEGQRDNALAAQKQALKALMKAQDTAMQQLADQMQQMMMLGMGGAPSGGGFGEGYDPLGRESGNGKATGGSIGLPNEGARRRVQEIQRELRERYNDGTRPRGERDYLERLLDLFK